MIDWEEDIQKIAVDYAVVRGGFEYDGKELAPLTGKRRPDSLKG